MICAKTFRYALAHLHGECRRKVILRYFQEGEDDVEVDGDCCDVCSKSEVDIYDCQEELAAIVEVVKDFPNKGVKKVCVCAYDVKYHAHTHTNYYVYL